MDFFAAMENDPSVESEVKQLLTQLGDHALPDPLLHFVSYFYLFLGQGCKSVRLHQTFVNQLQQKTEVASKEWSLSTLFNQQVDALKAQAQNSQYQISSYDQQILQ